MLAFETWTPLLAVLAGGAITWLAASIYYRKAAEDLEREAGKLRTQSLMILRGAATSGVMGVATHQ